MTHNQRSMKFENVILICAIVISIVGMGMIIFGVWAIDYFKMGWIRSSMTIGAVIGYDYYLMLILWPRIWGKVLHDTKQ